jgi:hypothetical protein
MRLNLRIVPRASSFRGRNWSVQRCVLPLVVELDREWYVGFARLLGHVMAHELGRLLLGSNAHSRQGIVCPRWYGDELHLASKGALILGRASSIHAAKTCTSRRSNKDGVKSKMM